MPIRLLLITLFLLAANLHAQRGLSGTVTDAATGQPLVHATVQLRGTGQGTITNEEGRFSLNYPGQDSIGFSYLGYETRVLAAPDLPADGNVALRPAAFETETITVLSGDDYLYDLLARCRKLLRPQREVSASRAYLHVISWSDDRPVEFAESYYNASVSQSAVGEIEFKNGRSYLSRFDDNRYFLNYNVSKALSQYPLVSPSDLFPANPLALRRGLLKRKYRLTLDHRTAETFFIRFTPRRAGSNFFSGRIAIDRASGAPSQLELESAGAGQGVFTGIGGIQLKEIDYRLTFSFIQLEGRSLPQYVKLNYKTEFVSLHDGVTLPVTSESILHLFAYGEEFIPPFFDFPYNISDYQLFTVSPRDSAVWSRLEQTNGIELTPRQKAIREELWKSGEYFTDTLSDGRVSFADNYLSWSPDSRINIRWQQPGGDSAPGLPARLNYRPQQFRIDKFNLDVRLYLDLNPGPGGLIYKTNTVLDPYRSFNRLGDNTGLRVYANLYFDLGEIYRRKLVLAIEESDRSVATIRELFDRITTEMAERQEQLRREVFPGNHLKKMTEWNDAIRLELGIDNMALLGMDGAG